MNKKLKYVLQILGETGIITALICFSGFIYYAITWDGVVTFDMTIYHEYTIEIILFIILTFCGMMYVLNLPRGIRDETSQ